MPRLRPIYYTIKPGNNMDKFGGAINAVEFAQDLSGSQKLPQSNIQFH